MNRQLLAMCLAATIVSLSGAAPARADAASGCSDISQPKCSLVLATGITLRYLEVGPSDGPAVFLLHGYTDSSRSLSLVMTALHRLLPRYDIIVPDLRGHGQSSLPAGAGCAATPMSCFEPIDFAHDIIAFMDARHIHRADIVGHSMGSLVAQELGLSYPDRIRSLVLVSTATNGQLPGVDFLLNGLVESVWQPAFVAQGYTWPDGVYAVSPGVAAPDFQDFLSTQWITSTIAPTAFLDQIRPETAATPLGTWIGALQAIAAADNSQRLRHLTQPTLVLWSVQDGLFSRAVEQDLIDALNAAAQNGGSFWWKQYGVLAPPASGEQTDFGHNLVWEAPDAVALDIASFLTLGRPTRTLYRSDYPDCVQCVIAEPGRASLIHAP
jgi:pimeloyl-ACP methyl ester carboxylesterase